MHRHLECATDHNQIDELQGADPAGTSSTHTAQLLFESITANTELGNTVYVALLDTTKLFDTVWMQDCFRSCLKQEWMVILIWISSAQSK